MARLPGDTLDKNSSGQALLLVLLSMAVVLTIVLSILSRSITDVAITTRSEESLRAFSAAEAGIERALIIGSDIGSTSLGDAEFSADVTNYAEGSNSFYYPVNLLSGEAMSIWFVAHDADEDFVCSPTSPCFTGDTIKICWGKPGTPSGDATTPAVEVSVVYAQTPGDYSTIQVARAAYDPNSGRLATNNFAASDAGTCTIDGKSFEFQKTIDLGASGLNIPIASYSSEDGLQFARVRVLYNSASAQPLGVDANFAGNSTLPAQGTMIASTGISGESNRKIEVFRGFGETPPIFDSALFSLGGLVK